MDDVDRIRLRLAQRLAAEVEHRPQLTVLHDNREQAERYAERELPASAAKLVELAEARGWAVKHGWSRVAVPAGYRESNHHKAVASARIVEYLGVFLAAYGVRAWSTWEITETATGKEGASHRSAYLTSTHGQSGAIGYEALVTYINGESEETLTDSESLDV